MKFVYDGPINNKSAFGSGNGLVQNRWQAITWTKDGLVYRCIYASPSH